MAAYKLAVGDKWHSRVDCASVEVTAVDGFSVSYRWDNGVTARRPIDEFLSVFDPPEAP